ncbi:membrane protein containing Peptidase M56, BlaR1 domain protein [Rhodopirellula sp. SWK7]|nr:membrane protein containing Peptidase M56, BlaR1 domain protein [Rhodopirellula sp. SWK7]
MDQVFDICCDVLGHLLLAGWRTLPIFAIVAVLALIMRNRIPARYTCWLWLIVVVRLLLPVSATSLVAISSVADATMETLLFEEEVDSVASNSFDTFTFEDDDGQSVTLPLLPDDATAEERAEAEGYVAKITAHEFAMSGERASTQQFNQVDDEDAGVHLLEPLLDLIGYSIVLGVPIIAVVLLLRNFVLQIKFAWKLRSLPFVNDQPTIDCLLRICDEVRVGRRPKLKEVPSIHSPAMFGLLRPVVLLPQGWRDLTEEQLQWVLRHEVAHVKGCDGLLLSIATFVKSIHWFNPLSWIAVSKLQHCMERAADELATLYLNETQVREYGELLLRFAADQPNARRQPTVGLVAMAAPKGLRRRIESLGAPIQKNQWLRGLMAMPIIGLVAASGLTDAKPIENSVVAPRQVPNLEVALAGDDWKRPIRPTQIPSKEDSRVVSINVESALQKAKELRPGIDAEMFVLTYFAAYPLAVEPHAEPRIVDGILQVSATEQQETLMKQKLEAFEQSGLWQIVTELRVIETNIALLNQFDWSASEPTLRFARLDHAPGLDNPEKWVEATLSVNASDGTSTSNDAFHIEQSVSIPLRGARISRLQSERLISQMQADSRSNIMHAPKVTVFNGQCAMIADMVQRPFVTDVFEVVGDDASAMQPKISVFEDGWKVLLKPTVTVDENVNLRMVITHASVDGVKLANLPKGPGGKPEERVTIQVPTVLSDSIAVESVMKESEALLVFSPKLYSEESDTTIATQGSGMGQVFMIRTRLISDNDFLQSFVPIEGANP